MKKLMFSFASLSVLAMAYPASADEASCQALAKLALPDTTIAAAEWVEGGGFTIPGSSFGPMRTPDTKTAAAFCRVAGTVSPAVNFEVWLPGPARWNGRFQAVGGGGLAGNISYGAMRGAMEAGYATASTDTGHKEGDLEWMLDPKRVLDYGRRAIHEMTLKSKAIAAAYYRRGASHSYFNGCSTGGRQGLMEAQRYPDDYDGIVVGAPVNHFVGAHTGQMWAAHVVKRDPATELSPAKIALINKAALAKCDADDGVADGVLEDPRRCGFDASALVCKAADGPDCLTAPQAEAVRKLYRGPVNPRTGERIYPGLPPGSEAPFAPLHGWEILIGGDANNTLRIAGPYFGLMVYRDKAWDWRSFDFDASVALAHERTGSVLNATDPNLDAFRKRGGKIIQHQGWNDPLLFSGNSVGYFNSVVKRLEAGDGANAFSETQSFYRLFMVPGIGHCAGGPGTGTFDAQAALEKWVEDGVAPDAIAAAHVENGVTTRTRPLCPYPKVAKYRGSGGTDDAANFTCADPKEVFGE